VCQMLGEHLGLRVIISGHIFRQMAKEAGMSLPDFGWACEMDPAVDQRLDQRIIDIARTTDNVLIEGRLAGYMLSQHGIPAFKVYLDADPEVRAARVAEREGGSAEQRGREIGVREECEARRYRAYYDIDIEDKRIYDLVVDTTNRSPEQVVDAILNAVKARK
jgi:predicted cytidylate kinase